METEASAIKDADMPLKRSFKMCNRSCLHFVHNAGLCLLSLADALIGGFTEIHSLICCPKNTRLRSLSMEVERVKGQACRANLL